MNNAWRHFGYGVSCLFKNQHIYFFSANYDYPFLNALCFVEFCLNFESQPDVSLQNDTISLGCVDLGKN